jgi:hypothetical protein
MRWKVDGPASVARWEVTPRWNDLRATTCPEDPDWTPGSGMDRARHSGWDGVQRAPRRRPACEEALTGSLIAADPIEWTGVRGTVTLRADRLISGLAMRDRYARKVLLDTHRYPEIRFSIDSLTDIQAGDTLIALAAGVFELRGVRQSLRVPVKAWREDPGLRVHARFDIPVEHLVERYGMSRQALGLALQRGIWESLAIELDVLLVEERGAFAVTP